jgi:hypothetical protein
MEGIFEKLRLTTGRKESLTANSTCPKGGILMFQRQFCGMFKWLQPALTGQLAAIGPSLP